MKITSYTKIGFYGLNYKGSGEYNQSTQTNPKINYGESSKYNKANENKYYYVNFSNPFFRSSYLIVYTALLGETKQQ